MSDEYSFAAQSLHPAQMKIVAKLATLPTARFSVLTRSIDLSSDHANFQIKKLVSLGLVEHVPKTYGEYRLTHKGKQYANQLSPDDMGPQKQAKLSVVLWVIDEDRRLLRQRRLKHPYYGYWTRPTGKIRVGESVLAASKRKLRDETGLEADLRIIGVEHRIDKSDDGKLLDDKYLFIVEGTHPRGELRAKTDVAENFWLTQIEYADKTKRFANAIETHIEIDQQIHLSEGTYVFDHGDY